MLTMRHSPRAMYPRTALFTALYDRAVRPSDELTAAQLQQARARFFPDRPPVSWITGGGNRYVGITYGTAPARDGYEVPLRIYRPRSVRDTDVDVPVVVFLHGGGFVQGNVVMYDPLCTHVASQVRAVVVSVDYRLAPEHRAPTAANDCADATAWVAGKAEVLRADTGRLAVMGDSAGGNLAAVVAQVLHDRGSSPVRHQALLYPALDLTLSSPSLRELAEAPMLTFRTIRWCADHYVAPGADRADPGLSPLFGELAGLPPALIQTADLDPLRDDGVRYADALRAAGVGVRHTNYVRVPHGFASFPGAVNSGPQQRAELVGELRAHLWPGAAPSGVGAG
jgi:acetyl esterase